MVVVWAVVVAVASYLQSDRLGVACLLRGLAPMKQEAVRALELVAAVLEWDGDEWCEGTRK